MSKRDTENEIIESETKKPKLDSDVNSANNGYTFTLYGYWRSSAAWRVRTVMNLKNLSYKSIPISLLEGKNKEESYAKLNPMCQLPCLIVEKEGQESFAINQSMAIMDFLERKFPTTSIYPESDSQHAKALELALDVISGIHPLQNLGLLTAIEELTHDPKSKAVWADKWITKGLDALEKKAVLSAGKFLVDDNVSIADICVIPQLYNARRFNVDLTHYPTLLRCEAEASKLDIFVGSHPDSQEDAVLPAK